MLISELNKDEWLLIKRSDMDPLINALREGETDDELFRLLIQWLEQLNKMNDVVT